MLGSKKLTFILVAALAFLFLSRLMFSDPAKPPAEIPVATEPPSSPYTVIEGKLPRNGAIYDELVAHHVSPTEVYYLINSFRKVFDFKRARPSDQYKLYVTADNSIHKFIYQTGPFDIYTAVRTTANVFSTFKQAVFINKRNVSKTFTLKDSLYQTILESGEQDQLVMDFADIFSWDIDFFLMPRQDDKITILFERYEKDGELIRYGKIQAAEYHSQSQNKTFQAFLFRDGKKESYYTASGQPLQKMFLKMPLTFARISSGFSLNRYHPILKRYRKHVGIDYASYYNAPVQATADGYVTFSGWQGGYGNLVIIRHPNGYETRYGHNNKNLVKKGQYIVQGQTIARCGSTGMSTGPHVHYEVRLNGTPINPNRVDSRKGQPLSGAKLAEFLKQVDQRLALLYPTESEPEPVIVAAQPEAEIQTQEQQSAVGRAMKKLLFFL